MSLATQPVLSCHTSLRLFPQQLSPLPSPSSAPPSVFVSTSHLALAIKKQPLSCFWLVSPTRNPTGS